MADLIGGWRLDCGCLHNFLTIEAGAHESIHCPLHAAAPALLAALINLVTAEDRYVRESGMKLDDPISAAVEDARAAIHAANGIPDKTAPLTMETYEGFKGSDS